ncbi:MAG: glycosyltransferase family 39 protein [Acidobacteria bacterium]|nr:glycosyltransferase family 39 protein [Acidobacteriota bacterium]
MTPKPRRTTLLLILVFAAAFAGLYVTHASLLGLPYYWDEAGYFIPAARDIYADGSFIPHSTLSNAHPPLVMTWLALAWKLFGFRIEVARTAMLAVSALALAGVYALGCRVANRRVGVATVVCTALYPVFFAQSSLAHLDMMVAALTTWALVFYLPPRRDATALQGDATPLRPDTTPLQADAMPLRRDTMPLRADTMPLRRVATPLRDDATPMQADAMALRDDATALRGDVMPLQRDVMALQGAATALRDGAKGSRGPEKAHVRRVFCVLLLALAALAKETAVLVPVVLCGWELVCRLLRKREKLAALVCIERRPAWWSFTLLLAGVPLALWFAYHRARTGYMLGNPEYFRYNVESTLSLARILDTVWRRLGHVTVHMNLWALTLAGLAAMLLKPRRDGDGERPRISVPVQLLFLVLILAHVVALSVVGGAVLARYMLPVLPLVVLVWVSTLWRRVPAWPLAVALVCAAFVYRAEVNPAYSFPWEENLAYRDFVLLHQDAARFLADRYPDARVLTSWPATDELRNPYYGYTPRALNVVPVENFLPAELERAAARKSEYDVALLYSTHGGPELDEAARLLNGRVVLIEERRGQWVAVLDFSAGG